MDFVRELSDLANDIRERGWEITDYEALTLATKVQQNKIFAEAFVVHQGTMVTPALEALAIALGGGPDNPASIASSICEISDAIREQ